METPIHIDDIPALGFAGKLRISSVDDPVAGFTSIGGVGVARELNLEPQTLEAVFDAMLQPGARPAFPAIRSRRDFRACAWILATKPPEKALTALAART